MAETIDTVECNIQAIAQHLQKRPFAPIFVRSNEKDDHIALKFMCIIDYNVQRWSLYAQMNAAGPKLLAHLMQFNSYGTFKYYDYNVGHEIGKRVLKCKFCELIGAYGLILTHMAISHNTHIGLKVCSYCNRYDLKKHCEDNSLEECYAGYIRSNEIQWDENVCNTVTNFYDMLKKVSEKFNIKTIRNYGFAGKGHQVNERLDRNYGGDIDVNVTVYRIRTPNVKNKNISGHMDKLDKEFNRVMGILYGGNNASRMLQQSEASAISNGNAVGDIITISDDEDGEDDEGSRATNTNRSFKSEADAATGSTTNNRAQGFMVSDTQFQPKVKCIH